MSSKLNPFSKSSGSSQKTNTTTQNTTNLTNDTEVNVVFDFEDLAEVYREQLSFSIEQSKALNDGEFTDEEKIEIKKIYMQEQALKLQQDQFQNQIKNNRITIWFSAIALFLAYLGIRKKRRTKK